MRYNFEEAYVAGLRSLEKEFNKKLEKGLSHHTVLKYWHEQKDEVVVYIQEREKRIVNLQSRKNAKQKEIDDIWLRLAQYPISEGGTWGLVC